mgnify:CR=1 FL=1
MESTQNPRGRTLYMLLLVVLGIELASVAVMPLFAPQNLEIPTQIRWQLRHSQLFSFSAVQFAALLVGLLLIIRKKSWALWVLLGSYVIYCFKSHTISLLSTILLLDAATKTGLWGSLPSVRIPSYSSYGVHHVWYYCHHAFHSIHSNQVRIFSLQKDLRTIEKDFLNQASHYPDPVNCRIL